MHEIDLHVNQRCAPPFTTRNKDRARYHFQMDMAQALASAAILQDWPELTGPKPSWMRQRELVPCSCGTCFFCKNSMTTGVMHRPISKAKVYAVGTHSWDRISQRHCGLCLDEGGSRTKEAAAGGQGWVCYTSTVTCSLCASERSPAICKVHQKELERSIPHKHLPTNKKKKDHRRMSAPPIMGGGGGAASSGAKGY
jgi:hypothetical protein